MSDPTDGICRSTDPELWWPIKGETIGPRRAKQFCAACPVRVACAKVARQRDEQFGIWAGFHMAKSRERAALIDWLRTVELTESVIA